MLKLIFGEKFDRPVVLAAGFFDCVHRGHASVINRANIIARENEALTAVFTFSDDPAAALGKKPQIYGFDDRTTALGNLGVDAVIHAEFAAVAGLDAKSFLDILSSSLTVKGVVAGADYTFGAHAGGNAETLREYFGDRGVTTEILPFVTADGRKIASTDIKTLVEAGDIEAVNRLLAEPYFMQGTVSHAHGRGKRIGFPTANIPLPPDRLPLCEGVYATLLTHDGESEIGITNVGGRPTFGEDNPTVETYLLDFCGDLYGKKVKLSFFKRLRGISRFADGVALAEQLGRDCGAAKEFFAHRSENGDKGEKDE